MLNKNFSPRNSVTYGTSCQAIGYFVFWSHHVTYRMPCHASGHLVIYCECYGFERAFLALRRFFYRVSRLSLGASTSTSKLVVLHADLQNIAPVQLFVWIITINKKGNSGRFYLRVMAGRLRYKKSEIWRDYEIWTLFAINEIS